MAIVGASGSLKCKLMPCTFKEGALRWYMSLPRFSVVSYQDLTKEMVQHFSTINHRKVLTTRSCLMYDRDTQNPSEGI